MNARGRFSAGVGRSGRLAMRLPERQCGGAGSAIVTLETRPRDLRGGPSGGRASRDLKAHDAVRRGQRRLGGGAQSLTIKLVPIRDGGEWLGDP